MIETKKTNSFTGNTPAFRYSLKESGLPGVQEELKSSPPTLLTVQDVAHILNIHVNTVRRWSDQGLFKPIRLGPRGDRRYKLQDITDYLVSVRSGAVPPKK
jgi:hypothetical protein